MNKTIEKENIFLEIDQLLSKIYPNGLYLYMEQCNPEADKELIDIEKSIDDNFLNCGSVKELKSILRKYWILHIRLIRKYREADLINTRTKSGAKSNGKSMHCL